MWSSRTAHTLVLSLALAACGYEPVSAPGAPAGDLRGTIAIDAPIDLAGQALVEQLERRLGLATNPDYRLSAELRLRNEGIGFTPDEAITRFNVEGQARYQLVEISSGLTVKTGEAQNFTSYSATSTQFATEAARRDAIDRLMISMADQITAELLLTAPEWRE